jgi:hypothetical protein
MMLDGIDLKSVKRVKRYQRKKELRQQNLWAS